MDRATQERWRLALEQKGLHVVRAELDMRPGRDSEPMYGIGDAPPYPTRAFCDQWCRGEYGNTPILSKSMGVAIFAGLAFIACIVQVIGGHSHTEAFSAHQTTFVRAGRAPAPRGPAPPSDDSLRNAAAQNDATQNSSVISSADPQSLRSSCSHVSASNSERTVNGLRPCDKLGSTGRTGSGAR